jgi:putative membrane protein
VTYGEVPGWRPERPGIHPLRLVTSWLVSAVALLVAAALVGGASVSSYRGAVAAMAVIAILNALLPPVVAAVRLPFTLVAGFLLVLVLDALMLMAAEAITGDLHVDSFWSALLVALAASALTVILTALLGTNDDDVYSLRVIQG